MGTLQGKIGVITGSTSGIGKAMARRFASEGCTVVVNSFEEGGGDQVIREITEAGGKAVYRRADMAEMAEARELVRFTVESFGRIDILVNNAIYFPGRGTVLDVSEEVWDKTLTVALKAPFVTCQEALPHMMRQRSGSIISTASIHGLFASNGYFLYDTVKAGLINQTRSIAVDFGRHGIRANAIAPGAILTEGYLAAAHIPAERREVDRLVYPLERLGKPEEIAEVALFLASDASSFITGTVIVADGGATARLSDQLYPAFEAFYRQKFAREWGVSP
jgi:NAD(P)-dependent dehydrogenase (short-subunit alcohol dehydrogenase family)